jgi:putative copper resistance protein D
MARTLVLFLHVLAAVYWVGEVLFDALVLGPVIRSLADRVWVNEVSERLRPRLFWSTWITLPLLVVTGVGNVALMRLPVARPAFWATPFGRVLGVKLAAVLALLVLVSVHGFVQIPALRRLRLRAREAPPAEAAAWLAAYRRGRVAAAWLGRVIVVLAVLIVFLGVWLVAGG